MAGELQLVQNAADRFLAGVPFVFHLVPVLKQLHQLSVPYLAQFKVLRLMFPALNDSGRQIPEKPFRALRLSEGIGVGGSPGKGHSLWWPPKLSLPTELHLSPSYPSGIPI